MSVSSSDSSELPKLINRTCQSRTQRPKDRFDGRMNIWWGSLLENILVCGGIR